MSRLRRITDDRAMSKLWLFAGGVTRLQSREVSILRSGRSRGVSGVSPRPSPLAAQLCWRLGLRKRGALRVPRLEAVRCKEPLQLLFSMQDEFDLSVASTHRDHRANPTPFFALRASNIRPRVPTGAPNPAELHTCHFPQPYWAFRMELSSSLSYSSVGCLRRRRRHIPEER
jgi:hypothetical protein